jgi:uncharacterized protein YuzE
VETLKILEEHHNLTWLYDEDADVLYISVGTPRPAVGADIGDGVIVRFDQNTKEIAGITILGLRQRTLETMTRQVA